MNEQAREGGVVKLGRKHIHAVRDYMGTLGIPWGTDDHDRLHDPPIPSDSPKSVHGEV